MVYCDDNKPLHSEEICIDRELWINEMVPKLSKFYKDCILPEMIRGNIRINKKCKDPHYVLEAIEDRENKALNRELTKIEKTLRNK